MSYDKGKTIKEYMGGGYAQPMKYQTGGYIPGISRALYGANLNRRVGIAQDEQREQAKALEKQGKRRGLFTSLGKLGGTIAGGALATALAPVTGGASLLAGAALAKGLGSAGGSFLGEKLAGVTASDDFRRVGQESSTGLLDTGFEELGDIRKEYGEGALGRSLATGLRTGLSAGGADYLMNLGKGKDVLEAAEGVGGQSLGQTQGLGLNVEAPSMTNFDLGRFYGNVPSPVSEALSSGSNTSSGLINQGTNLASSIGDMDFNVDQLFQEAYGTPTFGMNQGGKVYGYEDGGVIEMLQGIANKASFGRRNQVEDIEQSNAPMIDMEAVLAKKEMQDNAGFSIVPTVGEFMGEKIYQGTPEMSKYLESDDYRNYLKTKISEFDSPKMQGYAGGGLINMLPFNRRIM